MLPIMEGAMISANLATCLACWAGSTGGKAVGSAAKVDLVLWVGEGLTFSARGRTKVVSLPAEMVRIVVGLSVVEETFLADRSGVVTGFRLD